MTQSAPKGVPDWLAAVVNYCSRCGSPLSHGPVANETRDRLACTSCGFIAYLNPRLVVSTLPVTPDGRLVLIRRGIEPGYGSWAQPGGFLEIDETAHEGAVRETLEETGYIVDPDEVIGVYTRPLAAIVVLVWEARVVGGAPAISAETLEVRSFGADEIPWSELAFQTTTWAIRDWVRLRHPTIGHPESTDDEWRWPGESA
ncbi:MAG TPA: NUDIX hydrolase [Candidatus Limnocylindrales bacterium]